MSTDVWALSGSMDGCFHVPASGVLEKGGAGKKDLTSRKPSSVMVSTNARKEFCVSVCFH